MGAGAIPGHKKLGGRKKGIPNKRTQTLIDALSKLGYDAVANLVRDAESARKEYERAEEIHDAIQDNRMQAGLKPTFDTHAAEWLRISANCSADILPYLFPKRKAIEHSNPDGSPLDLPQIMVYVPNNARNNNRG